MLHVSDEDIELKLIDFYNKHFPDLIITSRIKNSLFPHFKSFLNDLRNKKMDELLDLNDYYEIEEFLFDEKMLSFIKERQPNISPVPKDVVDSVKDYFADNDSLSYYLPVAIYRHSNHPDDNYLYMVIGHKYSGEYACWSSWNQSVGSLNFGTYGLSSFSDAEDVLRTKFNDITNDLDKYGMLATKCDLIHPETKSEEISSEPVVKESNITDLSNKLDDSKIIVMPQRKKGGR